MSSDKTGRIYLRADIPLSNLNDYLGLNLPEEEQDTLEGLVFDQLGRRPLVGDEVSLGMPEVTFRVESTRAMGISEVSLPRPAGVHTTPGDWGAERRD